VSDTRDPAMADKIIAFLNRLPIIDGPAAGQKFTVDPWMDLFIRDVYEPLNRHGRRRVRSAILSCARKNAKSYLIAGLILAHLVGPAAVPNGQIFSAAVDHIQARVVFDMCRKIIEAMPALQRVLWVRDHQSIIEVTDKRLGSFGSKYKALSAVVGSARISSSTTSLAKLRMATCGTCCSTVSKLARTHSAWRSRRRTTTPTIHSHR